MVAMFSMKEKKENQSRPLSFWTEKDIDEYIKIHNVKISQLYQMGYSSMAVCTVVLASKWNPVKTDSRNFRNSSCQYSYFIENFGNLVLNLMSKLHRSNHRKTN